MEVMMILGSYAFGLNSAAFQELNRNTEWRWQSQDVFESLPVLQFTGYGKDAIALPGVIYPEYWGGTGQLDQLRALANQALPQTLIDGGGNILGEFVITNVQERQSVFGVGGAPKRQEFAITLERYGTQTQATIGTIPILPVTTSGQTAAITNMVDTAGAAASREVGAMEAALSSVQAVVSAAVLPIQSVVNAIGQGLGAARSIQSATRNARAAVEAAGNIGSLTEAQSALGGLLQATSEASQIAVQAGGTITGMMGDLEAAGEASGVLGVLRSARDATNRVAVTATGIRGQTQGAIRGFE